MQHYQKEFEETKSHVIEGNVKYGKLTGKITILFILIAFNLLFILLNSNIYNINALITKMQINCNKEKHFNEINNYIENHDYQTLHFYCKVNGLNDVFYDEDFRNYHPVLYSADQYAYTLEVIENLVKTLDSPNNLSFDYTELVVRYYEGFLSYYTHFKDPNYIELYSDNSEVDFIDEIEEMHTILITMIQHYFNLSDEEIENFDELSEAHKEVLLDSHIPEVTDEN